VRDVIALYEQARVGDTGCHLASVYRPGLPAHLWQGVQAYAVAVTKSRHHWQRIRREREEAARRARGH
jgi:hypothetical protein